MPGFRFIFNTPQAGFLVPKHEQIDAVDMKECASCHVFYTEVEFSGTGAVCQRCGETVQ